MIWTPNGYGSIDQGWYKVPATGGGEATVLIDVSTNGNLSNSNVSVTFYNIGGGTTPNVGSGPNGTSHMCLIAAVLFGQANGGTSNFSGGGNGLFWDTAGANQQFTQIPGAFIQNGSNGGDTYLFYLMNPSLGSLNFNMNWTGSNEVAIAFASFVNVDQTGGSTSFPVVQTSITSQSSSQTISVPTTPTTRKIIGAFNGLQNYSATTSQDMGRNISMNTFAVGACYDNASAGSLEYTASGTLTPAIVAAAIKGF